MENVTVKEELSPEFEELEFEELEFEDYKPETWQDWRCTAVSKASVSRKKMDKTGGGTSFKVKALTPFDEKLLSLLGPSVLPANEEVPDPLTVGCQEFRNKVVELFALQTVPDDTDGAKVPTCQNDEESSQIIIKEEIDCDINDGSVSDLGLLHFADKDPGPALRRSSRRRCPRFTIHDLFESSSDESSVSEHDKKMAIRSSRRTYDENPRLSPARDGRLLEGRRETSDRLTVRGKLAKQFCTVCGKWFSRIGYLRRHAAMHRKSKAYTCDLCGKLFARSDSLKEHERLHRGENFVCTECGKEFTQAGHLVEHARTHTGERPFRCADCGKVFRVRGYLRDHVRIHTGERPFACRICGKSFRQAAHLRGHARLHTGERRHGCDVCGRFFFRRTHLKIHACVRSAHRRRRRKV